jgi:hypothetical protein
MGPGAKFGRKLAQNGQNYNYNLYPKLNATLFSRWLLRASGFAVLSHARRGARLGCSEAPVLRQRRGRTTHFTCKTMDIAAVVVFVFVCFVLFGSLVVLLSLLGWVPTKM